MRIINRRAAPPLVGEEWREFTRTPLYALLALGLLLIVLAYQARAGVSLRVDVGTRFDRPYISGFNGRESNKQVTYRWSTDISSLIVPGPGYNQSLDLVMNLIGYRPLGQPTSVLTVSVGSSVVATLKPVPYPTTYTVTIPANLNAADDLTISFTSNAFSLVGDPRLLGAMFDSLTIAPSSSSGSIAEGLVRPPNNVTAWLLLSLLLLYLTLRHLRLPWQAAWVASASLMLVAAALLVFNRYSLTLFALPLLVVMLCVYGLALLLPPVAAWTLTRLGAKPGAAALQALMLIYLAAFAIKAGGMMHPQFQILDQGLRAHQVQELIANPAAFWTKYQQISTADTSGATSSSGLTLLGQWHIQVPIPYSPIAYYLFVPFGLLWPASVDTDKLIVACDTTLAALMGTLAFALYALAKRGLGSGQAGVIAAAITLFAPVSYLHFSDGDWTYIWGGWLAVVYIMAVVCLADKAGRPLPFAILSLLAALTIASHTAIALFAAAFMPLAVITILLMRRGGYGFPLWPLLASFGVGALLSLVYYGAYIWPLLTVTIPAIGGQLGIGLGQDQQYLGRPLLSGFWPQVWAHFTAWPLALAIAGLALLLVQRRPQYHTPTGAGIRRLFLAIAIAWAAVFALFSLADLKVNLLQRHMLFALPLLGLLAGFALVRLMQWGTHGGQPLANTVPAGQTYLVLLEVVKRQWFGWLVTLALVAFLFVAGWEVWLNRVINYVLPPGSG